MLPSWSSLTETLVSVTVPVFVTTYVHSTGSPTGMDGPGASSASDPLVYFSILIVGEAGTTLRIVQVTIASCGMVVLNPNVVPVCWQVLIVGMIRSSIGATGEVRSEHQPGNHLRRVLLGEGGV